MFRPAADCDFGVQRLHVGSAHTHRASGERVPYEVDLLHSVESTSYAARVLLGGTTWHALDEGTIAGLDRGARTFCVTRAVLTQIDRLDLHVLTFR
jgi:hypothetical protein